MVNIQDYEGKWYKITKIWVKSGCFRVRNNQNPSKLPRESRNHGVKVGGTRIWVEKGLKWSGFGGFRARNNQNQ